MPLKIDSQLNILIYSMLSGVLVGVLFDLYNIIRGRKIPKIIIVVEDILFWILTAVIVFTFLLYNNYAFLGPYVYIFMIITIILYLKLISPKIIEVEMYSISKLSYFIRILLKNIIYPVKIVYYIICGKK